MAGRLIASLGILQPDAGNVTMKSADAARLAGEEPDYHVKDMFNAIENGDFPTGP